MEVGERGLHYKKVLHSFSVACRLCHDLDDGPCGLRVPRYAHHIAMWNMRPMHRDQGRQMHTKKHVIVCCLCVVSQEAGYDIPKLLELGHSPNALCAAKVPVKELVKANVPLERSLAMILPTDVPQITDCERTDP